ncbi:MAG: hypothetical protein GY953_10850, partial [bacterium]|nr:hypothetical protein [bacterium]
MAYHLGLPVTDLHYLDREQTVELDWRDPWNSRFVDRKLWRARDAKVSLFLYVESYEVRVEVVARAVDLGAEPGGEKLVAPSRRGAIRQQAAEVVRRRFRLAVDGQDVQPELDRAHFLRRRLWSSEVVEDSEELLASTATLGIIYSYPLAGYPEEVTLGWEMGGLKKVAGMVTDAAASRPEMLMPGENVLRWENLLEDTQTATMVRLRSAPG